MHQTTTPSSAIVDLSTDALGFGPGGSVHSGAFPMVDRAEDWQLAVFHVETDADVHADHWEKHPHGEEAVCCVRGDIRLYLRATEPGTDDELIQLRSGQAAIVPRDRWHRLEIGEPTDLLAVTLGRGTQLEARTLASG